MSWVSELFHTYEQGASYSIFKNSRVAEERMEMLKFRSGMEQGEKKSFHMECPSPLWRSLIVKRHINCCLHEHKI